MPLVTHPHAAPKEPPVWLWVHLPLHDQNLQNRQTACNCRECQGMNGCRGDAAQQQAVEGKIQRALKRLVHTAQHIERWHVQFETSLATCTAFRTLMMSSHLFCLGVPQEHICATCNGAWFCKVQGPALYAQKYMEHTSAMQQKPA